MATNLHALIRYRTIDHCLRRPYRTWGWQELSEACGEALREYIHSNQPNPSRRSIMYDINTMRHGKLGYHAPIVYRRAEKSYRYDDPEFTITNSPLMPDDVQELRHALAILKQFSGFRQVSGIERVTTRLEHSLHLVTKKPDDIIHFDQPHDAEGLQWLNPLYEAIHKRQSRQLAYQPFYEEEPYETVISPLLLKEYNKRWFLIAWDHTRSRIQTFPLDRIQVLAEAADTPYHQVDGFSPHRYFRDIVGVSFYDEQTQVEDIRLWVSARQAPYLTTKPLHASQEILASDAEGTLFGYRLIPNYELESLILALGEAAEVRAPASLRHRLHERVQAMQQRYGGRRPTVDG